MVSVLVIDDEVESREQVVRLLKKAGHRVRCVTNGRDALTALETDTPDVVILSVMPPETDGIVFLETIRCNLRWLALPVLLMTAQSEGLHIRRAMELGVRKIFLKAHCKPAELLAHIEACTPDIAHEHELGDTLPPQRDNLN